MTFMTHDRLNERIPASTPSTIEEITVSEIVIPTPTVTTSTAVPQPVHQHIPLSVALGMPRGYEVTRQDT